MSTEVEERPIRQDAVAAAETARPPLPWWKLLAPALASSLLLWLGHFPMAWGWLGWVALAPLLVLVRVEASKKRLFLAAWLAGSAFFWPALQWMRVADYRMYATWAMLAVYCSFYLPLAIGLVRFLDRRTPMPLVVTVPVVWTALEYLRAHFLTGFAWYFLGHTQHDFLPMIQISDLTGAYGVTFVLAAVNAFLIELLWSRPAVRACFAAGEHPCRCLAVQGAAVGLLVAGTLGYGFWRLGQDDFAAGPRLALIQSNLDQKIRNDKATEDAARIMVRHNRLLTDRASQVIPRPDLIVWPETSYPEDWVEVAPGLANVPPEWLAMAQRSRNLAELVAKRWQTRILLGLNLQALAADAQGRRFNSAILILPDASVADQYHKMHRVPFGEYVPFRDWLPWMNSFSPYDFDYSITPGDAFTRFPVGGQRFGVIICYEDTDPVLPRQYVADDPVDFLVNISNDGWFDGTSEHDEHLAICRFRAVECRRAVLRSVNMGISAIIDGNGAVRQPDQYLLVQDGERDLAMAQFREGSGALPVSRWHEFKKHAGVLIAAVPLDSRASLYAHWGDWFPVACWVVLGVGFVLGMVRRRTPIGEALAATQAATS